jgi:hypothetical protein
MKKPVQTTSLPSPVARQLEKAEQLQKKLERKRERRGGRPLQRAGIAPVAVLSGNTEAELNKRVETLGKVIGKPTQGNKRVGRVALYADLVSYCGRLKAQGIALPQHHLSREQCLPGLADILKRHRVLPDDATDEDLESTVLREKVIRPLARVFQRIAKEAGSDS